jgi:hypothetical protein
VENASCATHSPVYSPCPSLPEESETNNEGSNNERGTSWNPTPSWGAEYNWTKEYRDNEKRIAKEWGKSTQASERAARDDAMSGGVSPPRKDTASEKKLLDGINDPHGELMVHESAVAVRERKEAKEGNVSMNITSPHGYRTRLIQITQKYPSDETNKDPDPYAYPVELAVTWTPIDGSTGNDVVSTLEIDPITRT